MTSSSSSNPRRLVVLISGSGTNLQALIDAQNTPALPQAQIVLVVSNRKAAYGLQRAASAVPPIPTHYLALQPYLKAHPGSTRDDYDREIGRVVRAAAPDVVVLAGWMHVFSEAFLEEMDGSPSSSSSPDSKSARIPVINIHPALPGAFDGTQAISRAHAAFQRGEITHSGVMVHRVVREVDRGEPVLVREVEMHKDEDEAAFEARVHEIEWALIVEATRMVLDEVKPLAQCQ